MVDSKDERRSCRAALLVFHPEAIHEMVEHEPGDIPTEEEVEELRQKALTPCVR